MTKLINVPNFSITTLPGATGGTWPAGLLRDSFQASNERRTVRDDRTKSAPEALTISETIYLNVSTAIILAPLTDAPIDRLVAEVEIPSFTAAQLPSGGELLFEIEASGFPVASLIVTGTGEDTEPTLLQHRFAVGSTATDVLLRVTRNGPVPDNPASVELRVFYDADQVRQVRYLTGHLVCKSESTTNAAFQAFIAQDFVTSPVVYHGKPAGGTAGQVYSGAWVILRVDVDDNQNSTSIVRLSVEQVGDWRDV